jgi:hypothetical protein
MPCYSCVDKLAHKLMRRHKIDMIIAYELAERGVERVENRSIKTPTEIESGNPTDYTQACAGGSCAASSGGCTKIGVYCLSNVTCVGGSCAVSGSCGCPAPLLNSHKVSECSVVCAPTGTCAKCTDNFCTPTCGINCASGTCGYDCDPPYIWNPVTHQCELPAVAEKIQGDGLTFAS